MIPGWTTVTLGDISRPKQWPILAKEALGHGEVPVYGANGVIGTTTKVTHTRPTVAVGCRGSCGTVHLTAAPSYINGNAMALDQLSERVDPHFLSHYLAHRGFRDVVSGSSQPQITRQNIVRVEVPLPPIEEQRRIAAILDAADSLLGSRRNAMANMDDLVRSWFSHAFADGAGERPSVAIGALGRVTTGKTPPTSAIGMFDGPVPFITPGDLGSGRAAVRTLTKAGAAASRTVRPGSTLVCCIGATIGKVDTARDVVAFNQQINAIEWGDAVDDTYGLFALMALKPTIVSRGASTTLPLLPKSKFEALQIPLPSRVEQARFAELVGEATREAGTMRKQLELISVLCESLQARAFSGRL